jgi:cyclopropane fatty-acyl-phospholipid synthase-like methyltransferase
MPANVASQFTPNPHNIRLMQKPFSPACERNQQPLLEVLQQVILPADRRLLEIGAGTGQHAVYLAPHFPWLEWHPTDLATNLPGMTMWFNEAKLPNIQRPVRLDVSKDDFPKLKFDVVFTANTFHIMHWKECKSLIKLLGHRLREGSRAVIYGPFKYNGEFTSESNAEFDLSLKARDPLSGIRAFEDVHANMVKAGFELEQDFEMPANNRTLVFRRLKFIKSK